MELSFQRHLPCDAETAFSLVSVPSHMNRWSTAAIKTLRNGDGDHPAGVGALRSVRLPGKVALKLHEVVVESEPGKRFVYRVYAGAPLRSHEGTIEITPEGDGCRLDWRVVVKPMFPAAEPVIRRSFVPELEKSLHCLVQVAEHAECLPAPPERTFSRVCDPILLTAAQRVLDEQREIAWELDQADDGKRWFTRVYSYVTEELIRWAERGEFAHPDWVLHLVPVFHRYYVDPLRARMQNRNEDVEAHWLAAFKRSERRQKNQFEQLSRAVFQGMRAHIEEDLPRALAEVYVNRYHGQCDYARFRGDYYAMAHVFQNAGDRLLEDVNRREIPLRARLLQRIFPRDVLDAYLNKNFYDIPRKRRQTFERGARLAKLMIEARS